MSQSAASSQNPTRATLQQLFGLPGVQHVFLVDHTGGCVAHLGNGNVPSTKITTWTVLARAVFGAADELGQRSDSGSCQELTQVHNHGGSLLRLVPGGLLLVVHFSSMSALGTLRLQARAVVDELAAALTRSERLLQLQEKSRNPLATTAPSGGGVFVSHEEFDEAFAPVNTGHAPY
jgi:predicted regulator of Ras-like GTPase activity (Roadblock/LC7/MglB family)